MDEWTQKAIQQACAAVGRLPSNCKAGLGLSETDLATIEKIGRRVQDREKRQRKRRK